MKIPSSLLWMGFILLLIFPTPVGKLFIDLAGSIFLIIALIPVILGGVGYFAWKRIQSKLITCNACGSSFLNDQLVCPICGNKIENIKNSFDNIPASAATIDVQPENID